MLLTNGVVGFGIVREQRARTHLVLHSHVNFLCCVYTVHYAQWFLLRSGVVNKVGVFNQLGRREQYYWVRYWYWVILGCFRTIGIGIGIVKGFSKYWYWYWVLLRAFQSIGIGIGYY